MSRLRGQTDAYTRHLYEATKQEDRRIVEATMAAAAELGVPQAQLVPTGVLGKPVVGSAIIGVSKSAQLQDALADVRLEVAPEIRAKLEAPYRPRAVAGLA